MQGKQSLDGLDLDNDLLVDDDIGEIAAWKAHLVIHHGNGHLSPEWNIVFPELIAEASLVGFFPQPRPKAAMDLHCQPDDLVRQFAAMGECRGWNRFHPVIIKPIL